MKQVLAWSYIGLFIANTLAYAIHRSAEPSMAGTNLTGLQIFGALTQIIALFLGLTLSVLMVAP
jgi:hypothetical protein